MNKRIIIAVIICFGLGTASGLSTTDAITGWYATLNKPFFNPPNWIFGPMWTLLYIMMGIAVGRIWNLSTEGVDVNEAIMLFVAQFFLNLIWSPVFFSMQSPMAALAVIITMWILILLTIRAFKKHDTLAGKLMIPYLLWVSFATILNGAIVYLN